MDEDETKVSCNGHWTQPQETSRRRVVSVLATYTLVCCRVCSYCSPKVFETIKCLLFG